MPQPVKNDAGHDIIVIGASAGGVAALRTLIGGLPADFPAAVFVVLHIGPTSHLADILDRQAAVPVRQAGNGDRIEAGCVYVAGPGAHLLLHDGHMMLRRGPRENMSRPAIDPLFRSAAVSFGGRVIGALLSGALNDGTAGLHAIKRCGGTAIVQDPADAAVPEMPANALRYVDVDYVVPVAQMPALLGRLAAEPAGATPQIPADLRLEVIIAAQQTSGMGTQDALGTPSRLSCPECGGVLWEIEDKGPLRYRCHVGHAYTADAALAAQAIKIEETLAALERAHNEHGALARRMAAEARRKGREELAGVLDTRAKEYEDAGWMVRTLRVDGGGFTEQMR
jgi:two-component system chemotaxis response regulator CheB